MSGRVLILSRKVLLPQGNPKLRAACEGDPKWNLLYDEYRSQGEEKNRLEEEIKKLKKSNAESKQVKVLELRQQRAYSKTLVAAWQREQRQYELEKPQLEDDLKTATSQQERERIQQRLEEVDKRFQTRKSLVHNWEQRANQAGGKLKQLESTIKEEESHRLIEEALSHGYVVIKIAITVVVGPAGVGKTHLKFLLLEKKPPALRSSTPGAEAPILIEVRTVSAERFQKLGKKWQEVSTDQMLPLIARYIHSMSVEKEEAIPKELKEYLEHIQTTTASTTSQNAASARPSDGTSTSSLESTPPSAIEELSANLPTGSEPASENEAATLKKMINSIMGKLGKLVVEEGLSEEDAEKLFSREWIYFTDSGGQPQFHELLPLFVRDVSSVVIVSRLCDRLDQYPIDEYYKDGKLIGRHKSTQLTCEDQMKCLIRSLLSRNSPDKLPKVIMVGTHLDKAGECTESIEQKDEKLIEMLGPEFNKQLVYYKPFKKLLFPLNALNPGEHDNATAGSVRYAIETSLNKEVKVPIKWYILEHLIQNLAKNLKRRVLSKKLCASIASALGFTDISFIAALQFFDELNVIKYSDALPEVVFVDSQLPLDKISELVQHSYMLKHGEVSTPLEGDWKRFCDEGVLNLTFLQSFPNHYVKGLFEAPQFLELLREQLVAVPLAKLDLSLDGMPDEYFMPALLDILSQKELENHRVFSSAAAPLLFRFSHGCRRAGVFCCLVVHLMKESKWSIQHENKSLILVARNCVKFRLPESFCIITLIDAFYFIEVHMEPDAELSLCQEVCPEARRKVLAGIDAACAKLRYTNDHPQLAVFCPLCSSPSDSSVERHAATILKKSNSCVCIATLRRSTLTEEHMVWLTEQSQATPLLTCLPTTGTGLPAAISAVFSESTASPPSHEDQHAAIVKIKEDTPTTAASVSQVSFNGDHAPLPCLDAQPSLAQLQLLKTADGKKIRIISRLAPHWNDLGVLMNFDQTGSEIETIEQKYRGDPKNCCRAVFKHWLDGNGVIPCSWRRLIELLDDLDQEVLAQEIQSALSISAK